MNKKKILFSVRDICEIAMLTGLAILLGTFAEIKIGENGGSIGFAMIPLLFICFRHGLLKGFIATGIVYGISTCAIDGYGFHCYPLDYLLAYGSLCIVSLFYKLVFKSESKWKPYFYICLSILIACVLRLAFHVISGMVLWETPFLGSLIYNIAYVGPSCLLCMILFCALYVPFKMLDNKYPVQHRI
ncbi:MAG: energy-coupled thiamine transporter ThiT [Bacillales bacterium]|nr:energy-coupled thiamine transporter ThiT [Bacillales bacterium]